LLTAKTAREVARMEAFALETVASSPPTSIAVAPTPPAERAGHLDDGRLAEPGEGRAPEGARRDEHRHDVEHANQEDGPDHGEREVPPGLFDVAGDGRHLREPEVGGEHQRSGREHRDRAERHERLRGARAAEHPERVEAPVGQEHQEDGQQQPDDVVLEARGVLRPEEVQDREEDAEGERQRDDGAVPDGRADLQKDCHGVVAEPDQVERGGEHQAEPDADADDRAGERAQRTRDEVVATARAGHGRRQLRSRQRHEQCDDRPDGERPGSGGPGPAGGQAGEDEDARPDHRPDADREPADQPDRALQFGPLLGDGRLVGLRRRDDHLLRGLALPVDVPAGAARLADGSHA
jgi:hypothetical protein